MEWIDEFLAAIEKGFAGMDLSTFKPIDCFDIFPLYAKEGINRIIHIIEKAKGYDAKELAISMHSPSVIRAELLFALIKARLAYVDQEKSITIANFYNSLLQALCLEDHYAKNGKNIIHTTKEINQFITKLQVANPTIAKDLGKLANSCYHLAYGLYSDINPQICYENYGPYDVSAKFGEDYILVVKQFQNLKPIELWNGNLEDFPYDSIRLYCVYKDVKFSMDVTTHAVFEGDLINDLKYFAVEINGELIRDMDEITRATEPLGLKAIQMWKKLTNLEFESAKVKYLEQRCFNYINICRKLGIDWRPTPEMLEAVKSKQLVSDYWPKFKNKEEEVRFWKIFLDPRVDTEELEREFGTLGKK